MSVRLSTSVPLLSHGTVRLPIHGFSWNLIFDYASKMCRENSSFFKSWQELRLIYMKTTCILLSYLAAFFSDWEMCQTKVVEKIKTHILCSVIPFKKSCLLWDNVEEYSRAGHATDGNMAHAHSMVGNKGYRHVLRICNNYCFCTATMVTRPSLNVTWYVHCLSCFCPQIICQTKDDPIKGFL